MTSDKTSNRRRYSRDFKAQVLAECDVPGTSVAKVAMSHGINTNVVHGWRSKLARESTSEAVSRQQEFLPIRLPLPTEQAAPERGIEVELRRGGMTMNITWPAPATADFAAWTRELLR